MGERDWGQEITEALDAEWERQERRRRITAWVSTGAVIVVAIAVYLAVLTALGA